MSYGCDTQKIVGTTSYSTNKSEINGVYYQKSVKEWRVVCDTKEDKHVRSRTYTYFSNIEDAIDY